MLTTPLLLSVLALTAPSQADEAGTVPYLGVKLYEMPPSLSAQLDIKGGALVAEVVKDSPAQKAGLRKHDIITDVDGKALGSARLLQASIRALKPGTELGLVVLRDAKPITVTAVLGSVAAPGAPVLPPADDPPGFLGIHVSPVPEAVSLHLGLEVGVGATVAGVLEESPARTAGIQVHDVIVAIADKKLSNAMELVQRLRERKVGERVDITWIHRGREQTQTVTLIRRPKRLGRASAYSQPFGSARLPGAVPRHFFEGRLLWKDPDGKEHVFEIPRFGVPDSEMQIKEWADRLKHRWEDWSKFPEDFQGRIDELIEKYHDDLGHWGAALDGDETRRSITVTDSSVDGYEVTIREVDGQRTVTVKKDGKVVVENLGVDKLDTLPKEIQERVLKVKLKLPNGTPRPTDGGRSVRDDSLRF